MLFSAEYPHNIVHSNAAYASLVQRGLLRPFGPSLASTSCNAQSNVDENLEVYISRIVNQHLELPMVDKKVNPSKEKRNLLESHRTRMLSVASSIDVTRAFACQYEGWKMQLKRQTLGGPDAGVDAAFLDSASESRKVGTFASLQNMPSQSQCISHFLLQIEPK